MTTTDQYSVFLRCLRNSEENNSRCLSKNLDICGRFKYLTTSYCVTRLYRFHLEKVDFDDEFHSVIWEGTSSLYRQQGNISSKFSRCFFDTIWTVMSSTCLYFQSHTGVLPVGKGLM